MSSAPQERRSGFGTPNFSPQANSEGTSDGSRNMPGYKTFKYATNNFSRQHEIGRGQLGTVYKAQLSTGEVVAVKVLYQMTGTDEEISHLCTKLMSVNHKNIVRLLGYSYEEEYEIVQYNGRNIIALNIRRLIGYEYVSGGSLANFLSDKNVGLCWDIRFKIIKGICEGVEYLHETAGIMHFNLNPKKILLNAEKVPKIKDFGLSWIFEEESSIRPARRGMWVPPDYIVGGMTSAYDIFSLGAIIKMIVIGHTMDYPSIADMDGRECVEHVHRNWKQTLQEIEGYPSFEEHCKQVKTCIEIAVACMQRDRRERPVIKDIVRKLSEVERNDNYPSSHTEQDIHHCEVREMPFMELRQITSNFTDKLGPDGFGAVCKGKLKDGEVIAVKRLDRSLRKLERDFERMVNLMRLEHKNIVRLTGYCYERTKVPIRDDKNPELYIIQDVAENLLCFEFLPRGNLDTILDDKYCQFDWQTRHGIIRGICEGLHHLHVECQDVPIVHEGIKPTNILLDDGMVPKLGDFCTSMGVTPRGYIAPEVLNTGEVTIKSNIYGLGVLIIEIATGERCPNNESSGRSYIENVLKTRMEGYNVALKYPTLEAGFVQQVECWINIGLKCVEIQPERRPTIGQILHFLETEFVDPEYYNYGELNLSSGSNIMSWSSSEMVDHANELDALQSMLSDASAEPTKLSFALLKSITRNFSRMIGRGGYGVVYLGILPKGKVAVKKLSILQDLSNKAFVDEIKSLKKTHHSNVVRLLGYCAVAHGELLEVNGAHVIAEETQRLLCFEYVPNKDLQDYIKEKCHGHEWQKRYKVIKGICHGLQYLHKQRISHLDLKPANVLLDANMEPKITDFGLSRFLPKGQSIVVNQQVIGTLGYIAPELINSGEISFKTDIYALGIIITKLLMRDINYDFGNWHKSLEVSCSQEERCIEIAKRCVEYSQDKRPTMDDIIHELNEIDDMIQEESPIIP